MVYPTGRGGFKLPCSSLALREHLMIAISSKSSIAKLTRLLPVAAACLWSLPANAANLLTNGTFDTETAPWWGNSSMTSDPVAASTMAVTEGKLCVTITSGGKNPWDVVLGYSGLALSANKYYRIAFSITSDVERPIKFKTGLGAAPYSDYFLKTITVGPTAKDVDVTYLNLREDPMTQFQFQIGTPAKTTPLTSGLICVDNVVIEEVAAPVLPAYVTSSLTGQPLKAHAAMVKMGTAVDTPIFLSSPVHNQIVAGEFSAVTPANSMKMNLIQPTQGMFDFVDTDALVAFAQTNALEFRGHPLVWHTQTPGWLNDGVFNRDEMIAIMYSHIDALMTRYVGKFPHWDVVNEAIDVNKDTNVWGFRPTIWHDRIGPDFIDLAFQRARAADPAAKLYYNDYNIEEMGNPKADRVYELVKDMKTRGIPIDGIGLQSHYFVDPDGSLRGVPDMAKIKANMDRYAALGLEVHVTECDFRLGKPLDDAKLQLQNKFYSDLLQVCIDAETCTHFTVWGLSDADSWVPSTFPEFDYAHLFDADLKAKPSYQAMAQVFAKYNADGTPIGGAAAPAAKDSGCTVAPARAPSNTASAVALLGLLGLTLLSRRGSKHRSS
jgi:endo-1,4-beta-xylanase